MLTEIMSAAKNCHNSNQGSSNSFHEAWQFPMANKDMSIIQTIRHYVR
jgi:hypothetical protein